MMDTWFAPIVEKLPDDPRVRKTASILLLLAPVVLVAGLALRWTRPAPSTIAIEKDHDEWIERGHQAARELGYDFNRWKATVGAEREDASWKRPKLDPPVTVAVHLAEPDGDSRLDLRFSPAGDLLGWSSTGMQGHKEVDDEAAKQLAIAAAQRLLSRSGGVELTDWTARDTKGTNRHRFRANARLADAPKASYHLDMELRGETVTSASIRRAGRSDDDENDNKTENSIEATLSGLGGSLTCFFLFYSLKLFRRRRREGEIPKDRALILIAVFGICGGLFVALNPGPMAYGSLSSLGVAVMVGIGTSLMFAVGGLFVAVAYAAGEGEVREGWPGKLLSLDALLAGQWSSQAVGVAVLVAATTAAWVFFLSSLAWRATEAGASILIDKELLEVALGSNVLARSLVSLPLRVSFVIVAGLFMPLAFIHRRKWTGRKMWIVLLICPLLVQGALRTFSLNGLGPLMTLLGMVIVVVVPFHLFDVLSAVLGALLFSALTTAAAMATAVPAVAGTAAMMLGVVTLAVIPLMAGVWRGKAVDERAVRPEYVRNLEERLSLIAEVSAARQAQLRLLPTEMPQPAGLSVAAYCQPAGVVGGDFFDFFTAPNGGLGLFVASGGGLGLASALTIALAKGFLASEVRRGEAPRASLGGLLDALSGRVGAAADQTGLLLMLVDPARSEVQLARRGQYPVVWLIRGRNCSRVALLRNGDNRLESGVIEWRTGDALMTHTEGFTALLDDQSPGGQSDWLKVTARRTEGKQAGWIEQDLVSRIGGRRGKRLRRLRRDVTTVVLRKEPV